MKNILVVGCLGFIGKSIKQFYEQSTEYKVYGTDLSTYSLEKNYLSFTKYGTFDAIIKQLSIDYCINASGAANVPLSIEHPLQDYKLNTSNVVEILESLRKNSPKCKFLNLSSAAVYGNPSTLPIAENSTINPISPYGYHKYMSEIICDEYRSIYSLSTCSLRIFSAYGPGLKKQLLWDLYQKATHTNHIQLFGTGDESRDFIYIKDLVNAIHNILIFQNDHPGIINIANGKEVFIKDIVRIFFKSFNPNITYEFSGQSRKGDPNNWKADISLLKSLGYNQEYTIEKGINKYVEWLKELG